MLNYLGHFIRHVTRTHLAYLSHNKELDVLICYNNTGTPSGHIRTGMTQ